MGQYLVTKKAPTVDAILTQKPREYLSYKENEEGIGFFYKKQKRWLMENTGKIKDIVPEQTPKYPWGQVFTFFVTSDLFQIILCLLC